MKKFKKIDFVIFDPKKSKFFIDLSSISEKPVNIVKRLFYYLLVGMDKVKNFCDHSIVIFDFWKTWLTLNRLNKFKLFIKRDHHRTLLDELWSKQRSDTALQKVSQIRQWVIKSSSRLDFIRLVLFTTCYKYHSKSRGYLLICLINCQGEICDQSIKTKLFKYRTRAIITRSWFETALDYKSRILRLRKVSCNANPSAV